ncbi:MAG: type IV toxin-antitoxin system AbiEi family antitoxin domain-containing protein [Atribacterota bacterium]
MRYIELRNNLIGHKVFSIPDIRKVDADFHRRRLNEWQDKGYIQKIAKGYYIFSDIPVNDNMLYYIANRIYSPSYVSLEMAFAYYNLIPESVYAVTSVSSRRKYSFETKFGEFRYRSVKPSLFFGYRIIEEDEVKYKIAEFEKCMLDYLYLNPQYKSVKDFTALRINKDIFFENVNKKRLKRYLDRFAQKSLSKRVNKLLEYLKQ